MYHSFLIHSLWYGKLECKGWEYGILNSGFVSCVTIRKFHFSYLQNRDSNTPCFVGLSWSPDKLALVLALCLAHTHTHTHTHTCSRSDNYVVECLPVVAFNIIATKTASVPVPLGPLTAEATVNTSDWEAQVQYCEVGKPELTQPPSSGTETEQQGVWKCLGGMSFLASCQRKEEPGGIMHYPAGWEVRIHTIVMAIECINNVLGRRPLLSSCTFGKQKLHTRLLFNCMLLSAQFSPSSAESNHLIISHEGEKTFL